MRGFPFAGAVVMGAMLAGPGFAGEAGAQATSAVPSPNPPVYAPPAPVPTHLPAGYSPPRPLGNPGDWIGTNDYPPAALRAGTEGTVGFRLTLDAAGVPSDCTVTASSGSDALDLSTCALVRARARFTPASIAGNPTTGTYNSRVRWVLPAGAGSPPPPVFAPASNPHGPIPTGYSDGWVTTADYPAEARKAEQTGNVAASLTVAPTGRVSGCAITLSSGFSQLDAVTCRLLTARGQFTPATDEAGNPTAGIWVQRVRWALPGVLPWPTRPSWMEIRITIEADGTQSHCEVARSEGQLSSQYARPGPIPCTGGKTRPYTDAAGRPVRKTVTVIQAVRVEDAPPVPGQ